MWRGHPTLFRIPPVDAIGSLHLRPSACTDRTSIQLSTSTRPCQLDIKCDLEKNDNFQYRYFIAEQYQKELAALRLGYNIGAYN